MLPSPQARFAGNPHLSGKDGGHSLNLHKFYRDGVTLLGHLRGVGDGELSFTPDLKENLVKVDKLEADILKLVDDYIARNQIPAPLDHLPVLVDGYSAPEIDQLDFKASGIATIIWAGGYVFDFSLVKLPVFDEYGFPLTDRGVTRYPGLFFLGMPWLHTQKSGFLMGVGEDAAYLVGKTLKPPIQHRLCFYFDLKTIRAQRHAFCAETLLRETYMHQHDGDGWFPAVAAQTPSLPPP